MGFQSPPFFYSKSSCRNFNETRQRPGLRDTMTEMCNVWFTKLRFGYAGGTQTEVVNYD